MGASSSKDDERDVVMVSNNKPPAEQQEEGSSLLAQAKAYNENNKKKMMHSMKTPRTGSGAAALSRLDRQLEARERRDDVGPSKYVTDDQVHVNLAMADLMGYLQVVANNSNNLPLTRRDDPELQHMVSTLTSEEFARKSAAFVPADVRVIGGTFLKYGNVWDLPTSDEYDAVDGAQEPGRNSELCRLCRVEVVNCL